MPTTVLIAGDSHVEGMGNYLKRGFEARGWTAVVYANRGKSTGWFAGQTVLRELVTVNKPDLVLLILGTNDEGQEDQPEVYMQKATLMLSQVNGTPTVWVMSPTIPRSEKENVGSATRNSILQKLELPYLTLIDPRPFTSTLNAYRAGDGVHFTLKGYQKWADWIVKTVTGKRSVVHSWKRLVSIASVLVLGIVIWRMK